MTTTVKDTAEELTPVEGRILTMEEIFAQDDRVYIDVEVPEWKGKVRIRSLNGAEAIEFAKKMKNEKERENAMLQIISLCAVNVKNERMFTDPEALKKLQGRNLRALRRLQDAAMEHNGFNETDGKKDEEAKKD